MFGSPLHSIFICVGSQFSAGAIAEKSSARKASVSCPTDKPAMLAWQSCPIRLGPALLRDGHAGVHLARHIDTESWRCR